MQNYQERIQSQIQKVFDNQRFKDATQGLFGDALLNQLVDGETVITNDNIEELISIASRIEQTGIRLWLRDDTTRASQNIKTIFEFAAKLFEQLVEVQNIPSRWVQLELYLHSAVDFSLGEFQANSTVMARKVLQRFEFETDTYSLVLHATFLLLRRDIYDIENLISELINNKASFELEKQNLLLSSETRNDALEEIAHFITLEAIFSFARYLRTGQNELFNIATSKIRSAFELFTELRDPDNFVLTQLILLLIRQMHHSSLWHQLGDLKDFRSNRYLNRYLHVLTNDKNHPIYELWPSQIDALEKILADNNAVVLQMPTSAGKTRIAELKIIHKLATSEPTPKCIYIAPYKSLVTQVEKSLDRYLSKVGYRVNSVFGSYESIEFEDELVNQTDVLVITPEKLDYLLRQNEELFQAVKLIVIDEGHLLAECVNDFETPKLIN